MKKRQRLGQHFLTSETVAKKIVAAAKISKNDLVLEIGTGKGILLPHLCKKAKKVVSIEADKQLYEFTKNQFSKMPNLQLGNGDGFKTSTNFTIFVSNLPYSKSRKALEWLIQKKYSKAIIMVQKEFYEKLNTKGNERKALSVLVNYSTDIKKIMDVNKTNFLPPPKVDSVVLLLSRKKPISKEVIETVNRLYSYKRKSLKNILKRFGKIIESNKRLEELSSEEIIKIAKQILK